MSKRTEIVSRRAKDDFEALFTAQGMEDAGGTVISIVYENRESPAPMPYVIFARLPLSVGIDAMDQAVFEALKPTYSNR